LIDLKGAVVKKRQILINKIGSAAVVSLVIFLVTGPALCQGDSVALLVQQSPAEGGQVSPSLGVHNFGSNTRVTLTATAAPGYQFVYWLGDVSEPSSNITDAILDSPKIIVAVFEKAQFDLLPVMQAQYGAPLGGVYASEADYSRGGISPVAGKRPHKPGGPSEPAEEPEEPEKPPEFPAPGGENFPSPEPIPEPATICLLGFGAIFALRARRTTREHCH
jgi:hypothetical protein